MVNLELELSLKEQGYKMVCGVDEAGRGPLAGPVCAAAVILPEDYDLPGLDDSKKLTEKKREKLYDLICEQAVAYSIAFADVAEIEEINILNAAMLAMNRAISTLEPNADYAIIDGNRNKGITSCPSVTLVGGDAKSASVAAASVLAKVTRDRLMLDLDKEYPEYCFLKHKGYGTKLHYEKLREFGPSPVHRMSFLKKMH